MLLLACLALLLLVPAAASAGAGKLAYARIESICPPPAPGNASCAALVRRPVPASEAASPGVSPYTVNDGAAGSGPAGGLTPAQLASAYNYATTGGTGQTVGIVDAFDDPNIEKDLAKFDTEYGLSSCTTSNGCFKKVSQTGSTTALPAADTSGWSVEISLDVEAVRAVCPNCKILLVEANNTSFTNLGAAVNEAVTLGATEVSNSYGGTEEPGASEEADYNHPGVVMAAATGDFGYYGWTALNEGFFPSEAPNIPASLPTVVSTGGTTLELNETGKRAHERVWNGNGPVDDGEFIEGASGGGCSKLFTAQLWQQDAPGFGASSCGTKRLNADVSAVADPLTGFDIFDSYNCGKTCESFKNGKNWLTIGGTSLSTPLISALYALAGGANGVSYPALTLYGHLGDAASLFDVSQGGNGLCDAAPESACGHPDARGGLVKVFGPFFKELAVNVDCEFTTACNAAAGFDGPSGVGSPNSLGLFKPAALTAAIAPPGGAKTHIALAFSGAGSSDPYPGASVSYAWSWGDGTAPGSGVSPTHTYTAPGKYAVTLKLSDSYGFTSAPASTSVEVTEPTLKEVEEAKEKAEKEAKEKAEKEAKEEAAAKKKVEEEAAAKKKAEEEAGAKKKAEEEATAKKKAEAEAAIKHAEEEAAARRLAEAEAARAALQGVSGFKTGLLPPIPDAELAGVSLQVNAAGAVTVKVSCPAGESTCAGTITLRTLGAVSARASTAKREPAVLTLASGSFSVAGGKQHSLTLHLSARARALLGRSRSHTLRGRATLLAHDPQGASHTTQTLVTLHAAVHRK